MRVVFSGIYRLVWFFLSRVIHALFTITLFVAALFAASLIHTHFALPPYAADYFEEQSLEIALADYDGHVIGLTETQGIGTVGRPADFALVKYTEKGRAQRAVVLNDLWLVATRSTSAVRIHKQFYPVSQRFVTDFASIPWYAQWIVNPFGRHAEAAILHDWRYAVGPSLGTRKDADTYFYMHLRQSGVDFLRAALMYSAVRLGGNDSFGTTEEWFDNFYDTFVDAPLPKQCVIDRPREYVNGEEFDFWALFKQSGDLFHPSQYENELKNVFGNRWRDVLSSDACLAQLGELYAVSVYPLPYLEMDYNHILSSIEKLKKLPLTVDPMIQQVDDTRKVLAENFELAMLLASSSVYCKREAASYSPQVMSDAKAKKDYLEAKFYCQEKWEFGEYFSGDGLSPTE